MSAKSKIGFLGLLVLFGGFLAASSAMAGVGIDPPPSGAVESGPEIWGVVVLNCPSTGSVFATARVKRVVDCNVETEAKVDPAWPIGECPASAAALEVQLPQCLAPVGTSFFGIPGTACVKKIKNFKVDGDVVSFDAQFKFWQ